MPYKEFVAGEEGLASDVNTYLMNQAVMTFTNATDRNTQLPTPTDGMVAYLQNNNHFQISTGSEWVTHDTNWNAYTPTFTNFTLGNGTVTAKYYQMGKIVTHYVFVTLGSTSSITGNITFSLPVSAVATNRYIGLAKAYIGTATYPCFPIAQSATTASLYAQTASGTYVGTTATTSLIPAAWGTGSFFLVQASYEVA